MKQSAATSARYRHLVATLAIAAAIIATSLALNSQRSMSPVWYGPYLSAAENASWGGHFLVNLDEVVAFSEMTTDEREAYRFKRHDDLQPYIANPLGFAYAVAGAKYTFPWLPDVRAIEAMHIALHVLLSLLVIGLLNGRVNKALFLLLYSLNPVVLYFVTYPYYYFYQAIPSFALIFLFLGKRHWKAGVPHLHSVVYILMCAALAMALLIRTTTIAAIAAFFLLAFIWMPSRKVYLAGFAVFLALAISGYSPSEKNFWHTAYVGVGAYPNAQVVGLTDDNGYALFEQRTGRKLDASLHGNYNDSATLAQYRDITRIEFMRILGDGWMPLLRNAILNGMQGFTIGYLAGKSYGVHLAMSLVGFAIIGVFLITRQCLLVALIAVTIGTFTPYYPPIPAYMYGAYALLVFGAIRAVDYVRRRRIHHSTITSIGGLGSGFPDKLHP